MPPLPALAVTSSTSHHAHLCPGSPLLFPLSNSAPAIPPPPLQRQLSSNSTRLKLNSGSPAVSFSACSLPHLSGGQLHPFSHSGQKPWSHPRLLSSRPTFCQAILLAPPSNCIQTLTTAPHFLCSYRGLSCHQEWLTLLHSSFCPTLSPCRLFGVQHLEGSF